MSGEEWRPVLGYEGCYEVSNQGRVRSVERYILNAGVRQRLRSQVLRARPVRGYPSVALYGDGGRREMAVHVLVAEAWHGPRPDGMEVCHINDIKADNRPENLRFGTRSENLLDRVRNGIDPNRNKTHCKNGHEFTPENTAIVQQWGRPGRTYRRCRTCNRQRSHKAGTAA